MKVSLYLFLFITSSFFSAVAEKSSYEKMIDFCAQLTEKHPSVLSAQSLLKSAKEDVKVTLGVYYPNMNFSVDQSFTKLDNTTSSNPSSDDRDIGISISQLIYDFGKSNLDIQVAVNEVKEREYQLEESKQDIFLQGLELCLDYSNTFKQVQYEEISAANFKRQMELETTKVQKGQGYSTDVLQAEAQWLGAKNRKLQQEALLQRLLHEFESLYGQVPNFDWFKGETIHKDNLEIPELFNSESLISQGNQIMQREIQIRQLISGNPRLMRLDVALASQRLNKKSLQRNRFSPTLSGVVSGQLSDSDSLTNPYQKSTSASIELSFPFNLGFTSLNEVSSLNHRIYSLERQLETEKRSLVNTLKDDIINWRTSNQSIALLKRQVEISEKFLEGAEKERTMGRRSLIDVINGELILIRAKSSLEQAEIQALKSWFRYLSTIGNLALGKL